MSQSRAPLGTSLSHSPAGEAASTPGSTSQGVEEGVWPHPTLTRQVGDFTPPITTPHQKDQQCVVEKARRGSHPMWDPFLPVVGGVQAQILPGASVFTLGGGGLVVNQQKDAELWRGSFVFLVTPKVCSLDRKGKQWR